MLEDSNFRKRNVEFCGFLYSRQTSQFFVKIASQNQITLLRKLKLRKHRIKEHKFLVEGERAVEQVLVNGLITVESIFIKPSKLDHFSALHRKMHLLENDVFSEISDTETPQGIIAVCTMPSNAN